MVFPKISEIEEIISQSNEDLSDTILISSLHIMASNATLIQSLNSLGMRYADMYLLGKDYSANQNVADELAQRGAQVHIVRALVNQYSTDYRSLLLLAVIDILKNIDATILRNKKTNRILIMDDGGVLISAVNGFEFVRYVSIFGVEQTTSGVNLIGSKLAFPVVNVARCRRKLIDESPIIAESFIASLKQNIGGELPGEILIIGNGAVGSHIYRQLKKIAPNTKVYDSMASRSAITSQGSMLRMVSRADVIIGATGSSILTQQFYSHLRDGVILASASSSNIEFLNDKYIYKTASGSSNLLIKLFNGNAVLLNRGYPVNFDRSPDPIPVDKIKVTRILMLKGALQALSSTGTGLIRLNE